MKPLKLLLTSLAAGLTMSTFLAGAEEQRVNVFNWSDYIAPNVVANFQKETGIQVKYDVFESNEILEAKLLTGNSGYDVVVPADSFASRQISAGAFLPLDRSQIPNWKHLDPVVMKLLERIDPGNRYVIPYMSGTNLIGYNIDKVKAVLGDNAPIDSWDLVFKEENLKKLSSCGVAFLDSSVEMLPMVLRYLGLDPNSERPEDYDKAQDLMLKLRPYVTYFHNAKWMGDIASGNICVAVGYSGGFLQAANQAAQAHNGVHIAMRLPKEGTQVWFDTVGIPKSAKNVPQAHAFMNYLLEPQVTAAISNFTGYPNGNKDATPFVDTALRENPDLFPSAEVLNTLFTRKPLPAKAERIRTRAWVRITSGQ